MNLDTPFDVTYNYVKNSGSETTLVSEIHYAGTTLSYDYDQFGNITAISNNGQVTDSYEYDKLNQLVKWTRGYRQLYKTENRPLSFRDRLSKADIDEEEGRIRIFDAMERVFEWE